jgi:hypothetical protein
MDHDENDDLWEYDKSRADFPYLRGTRGEFASVFMLIGMGVAVLASMGRPSLLWLPVALALPLIASFIVRRLPSEGDSDDSTIEVRKR